MFLSHIIHLINPTLFCTFLVRDLIRFLRILNPILHLAEPEVRWRWLRGRGGGVAGSKSHRTNVIPFSLRVFIVCFCLYLYPIKAFGSILLALSL